MIKLNQPLTLVLNVNDVDSGVSAMIEYEKPNGAHGTWSPAVLDTGAATVTYEIPENALNAAGKWKAIAVVTFSDGKVIPGEAYTLTVRSRFD